MSATSASTSPTSSSSATASTTPSAIATCARSGPSPPTCTPDPRLFRTPGDEAHTPARDNRGATNGTGNPGPSVVKRVYRRYLTVQVGQEVGAIAPGHGR